MAKIEVKPDLLKWAILRCDRPREKLEKSFPKIWDWIAGRKNPTLKQLEKFAKYTYTPLGYFFLQAPPEDTLPIPFYRTVAVEEELDETASANLRETIQIMQLRQSWLRDYLIEQDVDPLSYVHSATMDENIETVAQRMREALKLKPDWASSQANWTVALNALRETIEDAGILVVINGIVGNNTHRKLNPGEFRGFVLVDEYAPLLFVNGADGKAAQMFTLAHELAHVFFGHSAAFDLRASLPSAEPIEKKCDQIAAEFLVPAKEFHNAWNTTKKMMIFTNL